MTDNLGVDSRRCAADCTVLTDPAQPKTQVRSAYSRVATIAALTKRAIFLGLRVSREFSRGIVFRLIVDENERRFGVLARLVQVFSVSLNAHYFRLSFVNCVGL